eukprot:TRINITY_DN3270_c0_g1_i1.p1 TRINITY_DN3270_c0_g1~~TRINITY_DN3270_c0_g1_i1.p1  ORF type:complete len:229 (-),score=44.18 TRINITY_DN3270_c0_g1_i1:63-707(-)
MEAMNEYEDPFPGSGTTASTVLGAEAYAPPYDTLNESVFKTLGRDLLSVLIKLGHVVIPFRGRSELQDWDLWGPLLLSLILAVVLSSSADEKSSEIFSGVFVIVWFGSVIVTVNALLLGGKISFFQTVCALGYCLGPLDIAAVANMFYDIKWLRIIVVGVCFAWSIASSWSFVRAMMPVEKHGRTALVIYPVILFYLVISWMVAMMNKVIGSKS